MKHRCIRRHAAGSLPPHPVRELVGLALVVALVAACGDSEIALPDPPDGSAGWAGGTLVAPNSQILAGGELTDEVADLGSSGLAAVLRDGEVFLFHPAVGEAVLSEDTSRLALEYWLAGLDANGSPSASIQQALTYIIPGAEEPERTSVGIDLRLSQDGEDLTATNRVMRWAAVDPHIGPSGTPDDRLVYYLLPAGSPYSTSVIDRILGQLDHPASRTNERTGIRVDETAELYGSVLRGGPLIWLNAELLENAKMAWSASPQVFENLLMLDLGFLVADTVRNFGDVSIPINCADFLVDYTVSAQLTAFVAAQLNGGDVTTLHQVAAEGVKSYGDDFVACLVEVGLIATTGVGAVLAQVVKTVIDLFDLGMFVVHDVVYTGYQVALGYAAYEAVQVSEELDVGLCSLQGVSDPLLLVDVVTDVEFGCQAPEADDMSADLRAIGGEGQVPMTQNPTTLRWEGGATVYPTEGGDRVVTFSARDAHGRSATDDITVPVLSCGDAAISISNMTDWVVTVVWVESGLGWSQTIGLNATSSPRFPVGEPVTLLAGNRPLTANGELLEPQRCWGPRSFELACGGDTWIISGAGDRVSETTVGCQ